MPSITAGSHSNRDWVGRPGMRMKVLLVRTALGVQQEMGTTVSDATKGMRMPGERDDSSGYRRLYDSVRAGPHRPFQSGEGDAGTNQSIIHVVYDAKQV